MYLKYVSYQKHIVRISTDYCSEIILSTSLTKESFMNPAPDHSVDETWKCS